MSAAATAGAPPTARGTTPAMKKATTVALFTHHSNKKICFGKLSRYTAYYIAVSKLVFTAYCYNTAKILSAGNEIGKYAAAFAARHTLPVVLLHLGFCGILVEV